MSERILPIDEIVWRLGEALRRHRLEGWEIGFAASIVRQAKRGDWSPSTRQERAMRNLVDGLMTEALIDDGASEGARQ
jgi:hypothetical protein